ncbi:hypothetical protein TBLA_0I03030 [Henningerozyma blattae CBS 6284]|uniref:tRNA-dihydrouridine(47) synthase [NAD(P)(+)] n=1 Tax=Henningerozyma blattae (strain ATCC 34711 / CBS 6284 / DSM 70876 / NBRC 10599 / NRRL Y-10934 / UCD 77-7) TaxID=1071380 RepID=I2H9A7_HENB6|nr:hypothetical protein TBLA_0I03030 [Tetrapisispora blattae CBS 6284]CCH62959.1 hypothetical protein TBLA_0I03030 [Tetrapisispora blattae CBS 6284]
MSENKPLGLSGTTSESKSESKIEPCLPAKRALEGEQPNEASKRALTEQPGTARVLPQFRVANDPLKDGEGAAGAVNPDNANEGGNAKAKAKAKKRRGQNKDRDNRQPKEQNALCPNLVLGQTTCPRRETCRHEHDVSKYLSLKKPEIITSYFPTCPNFSTLGYCPMGFRCRFLSTHSANTTDSSTNNPNSDLHADPQPQLLPNAAMSAENPLWLANHEINKIDPQKKRELARKQIAFVKSDFVVDIMEALRNAPIPNANPVSGPTQSQQDRRKELINKYKDTRFFAQEKKPLDLHGKKILAPLTTVGNLPYRRLMRKLGADVTYSEMALALPMIQGTSAEWALPTSHISESQGYGIQLACSKPWQAAKACEAISTCLDTTSAISEINLNSGCPIDLLHRQGAGCAMMENPAKLIRCLNAMNYTSNDIPITLKLRTGAKDNHPIADTLITRIVQETDVAAFTLHGRSRQQRYTRDADWNYISQTAAALRMAEQTRLENKDDRDSSQSRIQFVGNGDIDNYQDWHRILDSDSNIDSLMVARSALIKPWIFEEIDAQQHLDKSSSERLQILRDYADFAMQHWGTDEYGIATSRRYFCEFMSFFHRYVPVGVLERVPIRMNQRVEKWKGRDELETLMASEDSRDWIKLSEMFWGKAEGFVFVPKHKSSMRG